MKTFLTILFLFTASIANADDISTLRDFTAALQSKDYSTAKQYVSTNSEQLFDRYSQYDLGDMTPSYGRLISQSQNSNYRYLKVAAPTNPGQPVRATNVAFITENNNPKIDLPETLRLGFGPNWEQRINMIEQSYIFTKQQFGEEQSRQVLNTLVQKGK